MISLRDDCQRLVAVPPRPQRVICLCPSLTETLLSLGLGERLVGRTRYCVHPQPQIEQVAVVGGTKQLEMSAIYRLQPDLIIAEKEENRREDVLRLAENFPVFVLDIRDLKQAGAAIQTLGRLCRLEPAAARLGAQVDAAWQLIPPAAPRRVLYLIWRKPWMAAGGDTYIDAVLTRLGWANASAQLPGRYPSLETAALAQLDVDDCLLSSEPYPFTAAHLDEVQRLLPQARIHCVDGEMFSWYGARMLPAAAYLSTLARDVLVR